MFLWLLVQFDNVELQIYQLFRLLYLRQHVRLNKGQKILVDKS